MPPDTLCHRLGLGSGPPCEARLTSVNYWRDNVGIATAKRRDDGGNTSSPIGGAAAQIAAVVIEHVAQLLGQSSLRAVSCCERHDPIRPPQASLTPAHQQFGNSAAQAPRRRSPHSAGVGDAVDAPSDIAPRTAGACQRAKLAPRQARLWIGLGRRITDRLGRPGRLSWVTSLLESVRRRHFDPARVTVRRRSTTPRPRCTSPVMCWLTIQARKAG
jgi:hypothetical protein